MENGIPRLSNGDEMWVLNKQYHRIDGPAYIHKNGSKSWYQHGKRHRTDGPAIMNVSDGYDEWYINGIELTESEVLILKEGIEFDEMMRELLTI